MRTSWGSVTIYSEQNAQEAGRKTGVSHILDATLLATTAKYAHRDLMLFVAGESNSCALSVSAAVSKYAYL